MQNNETIPPRERLLRVRMGKFWSGEMGLTLLTLSLAALVFVVTPLREAGLPGRELLDLVIIALMLYGAIAVQQKRITTTLVIILISVTAVVLVLGRLHPTPFLRQVGSVFATITLLLYFGIVLLVLFRTGPITWSRIQGGICAYLLLGMTWASSFQIVEQSRPGSFRFVTPPADFDQLISKLTYFSFCTLTTLGGEVTPISPIARSLTIAEAMVGQLFPAILIGALVGMAMQSQTKA